MSRNKPAGKPGRTKSKPAAILLIIFVLLVLAGGFIAFKIWGPNTGDMHKGHYLYIPTGASYLYVKSELKNGGYVADINSFDILAKRAKYPDLVKAGRYKIPTGISNYDLIRKLRSGNQEPVKLIINKVRTIPQLVSIVAFKLEADSASLIQLFHDNNFLKTQGFDTSTAIAVVIPDTYEFYWNTSAEKFFERMKYYYDKFWNNERKQRAFAKNLTPVEVMTLASIVDEETNRAQEKPLIASVYLNRLTYRMRLQADPTVKFAMNDFTIKRVLSAHLEYNSPYNTYMYEGLPPGPICTPSKSSIIAVLNAPSTNYLYFCAKPDFSGYHNFASTFADHVKNAKAYQRALNDEGIR